MKARNISGVLPPTVAQQWASNTRARWPEAGVQSIRCCESDRSGVKTPRGEYPRLATRPVENTCSQRQLARKRYSRTGSARRLHSLKQHRDTQRSTAGRAAALAVTSKRFGWEDPAVKHPDATEAARSASTLSVWLSSTGGVVVGCRPSGSPLPHWQSSPQLQPPPLPATPSPQQPVAPPQQLCALPTPWATELQHSDFGSQHELRSPHRHTLAPVHGQPPLICSVPGSPLEQQLDIASESLAATGERAPLVHPQACVGKPCSGVAIAASQIRVRTAVCFASCIRVEVRSLRNGRMAHRPYRLPGGFHSRGIKVLNRSREVKRGNAIPAQQ